MLLSEASPIVPDVMPSMANPRRCQVTVAATDRCATGSKDPWPLEYRIPQYIVLLSAFGA